MVNSTKVLVVVVNYCNPKDTTECIKTFRKHISNVNTEILLIENSPVPTGAGKQHSDYYIVCPNNGFSHACNIGIQYALEHRYSFVLLLNNDTIIDRDFLSPLVELLENDQKCAAVSPKIINCVLENGKWHTLNQISFAGGFTPKGLEHWYPRGVFDNSDVEDYALVEECDWLSGGCMLIKTTVFEKVGLFDESFFLYYEDIEWCLRARNSGFHLKYHGGVRIYHQQSKSTGSVKRYYYPRAFLLFLLKTQPKLFPTGLKRFYNHYLHHHLRHKAFKEVLVDCKILLSVLKYALATKLGLAKRYIP